MRHEHETSYRGSLKVGLTVSALLHVALVAAYAAFWSKAPDAEVAAVAEPSTERSAPSFELVRLPEPEVTMTPDESRSSAAVSPAPDVAALAANVSALEPSDLELRMAAFSSSAPRASTVAVGTVTARLDAAAPPTGADGWYPGKYTEEHGDHDHVVLSGRVLGLGPTCSYGSVYTSVNQRSPFGN